MAWLFCPFWYDSQYSQSHDLWKAPRAVVMVFRRLENLTFHVWHSMSNNTHVTSFDYHYQVRSPFYYWQFHVNSWVFSLSNWAFPRIHRAHHLHNSASVESSPPHLSWFIKSPWIILETTCQEYFESESPTVAWFVRSNCSFRIGKSPVSTEI